MADRRGKRAACDLRRSKEGNRVGDGLGHCHPTHPQGQCTRRKTDTVTIVSHGPENGHVSNLCCRAFCAEYFSRTAPGRWSVIADFAATSWGVGARACVMKIGSLFRYGYPCRAIRASVNGWTWGNSLCLGLRTRANDHASHDPLEGLFSPILASVLCQCRCVTSNICPHALS